MSPLRKNHNSIGPSRKICVIPLNPMLSTIRDVETTQRSICLPDFPAVSQVRRYSFRD